MVTFKNWLYRAMTEADFGSQIDISQFPKEFPVRKMQIMIKGDLTINAGGAADYVAETYCIQRLLKNLSFKLGSGNLLKDIPGYASWFSTQLFYPNVGDFVGFPFGQVFGVGTYEILVTYVVNFYDPDVLVGDGTMLMPSLYEDLTMNLEFNTLTDITSAGDRPFTFAGTLSVSLEQENAATVTPVGHIREFTETKEITAGGILEIDLPRTELIERIHIFGIDTGHPSFSPFSGGTTDIDVENGKFIPYTADFYQFFAMALHDSGLIYPGFKNVVMPILMIPNHDLQNVFDNRSISKWTLKTPVAFAANRSLVLHYFGRTP